MNEDRDNEPVTVETKKILLVDDEPSLTGSLAINLEATGKFEVRAENDPQKAVAAAREFRPDIILLDFIMPGMDGGDVKAAIKSDFILKNTPIIMITALVSHADTADDAVIESSGDIMLAKPVRLGKLVECIEQKLGGII
jgi:DNA-binding response OmpR family regulator